MSAANPRYYKWYPTEETDLGTMPFEGDWTTDDRVIMPTSTTQFIFFYNVTQKNFGRWVTKMIAGRPRQVWEPGVVVSPQYIEVDGQQVQLPVWFSSCGDGVCTVKLPNGEQPEPYDPTEG